MAEPRVSLRSRRESSGSGWESSHGDAKSTRWEVQQPVPGDRPAEPAVPGSLGESVALAPGVPVPRGGWGRKSGPGHLVLTVPRGGSPSREHAGRIRWAGCSPPRPPALLPTAGPRSPDPCRFPVLWPETPNLPAGRRLAHFREQPPGPGCPGRAAPDDISACLREGLRRPGMQEGPRGGGRPPPFSPQV